MEIKFFDGELEKLVSDHLIENNYKLENYPELVIDNGVAFVKVDVELQKSEDSRINNSYLETEEIMNNILNSHFWITGQGNFDLTFEQMKKIIEITINTDCKSERIKKISSLYDKWNSE